MKAIGRVARKGYGEMADINHANYRTRHAEGDERQFRQAVRVAHAAYVASASEWRRRSFQLIAESLVRLADLSGFTIDVEGPTAVFEKEFDFGAQVGIGGQIVGRFTATAEQMTRWLTVELERRDARIRVLESWWPHRLARHFRAIAMRVLRPTQ